MKAPGEVSERLPCGWPRESRGCKERHHVVTGNARSTAVAAAEDARREVSLNSQPQKQKQKERWRPRETSILR